MKLLILSFYYPPDLSAGSFRTDALVKALLNQLPENFHIELVTTLPNRYQSFSHEAPQREEHPRLTIHRISLPPHQSGMKDQAKAFLSYARGVSRVTRGNSYDFVFSTSSRLMTAALGAWLSRRLKKPLYLDVRDIFVDTMRDVLSPRVSWLAHPFLSIFERWTIRQACRVNLVSQGFLPYFKSRYPKQEFVVFTNGIDEEFLKAQPIEASQEAAKPLSVVYAGNMGEGQGLHTVMPALARQLENKAEFLLIGDGGRRSQLEKSVANCRNVELRPPVARKELIKIYQEADVLFLHLNDYDAFRKVLPSKIFEYGALGKPILAGVAGHAAEFINEHLDNAAVFPSGNAEKGAAAFLSLKPVTMPRQKFVERFARERIMSDMAADIIKQVSEAST